ncbi:TonB-dependent receptor [Sphingobium sp. V4]|uniref:TonB-dependent receptor n=1 Tax=Sphingobium sp. V4 TaxID=3038927 RepID=UPI002557D215|nr:TonB-dependent receptor [Sphingobium sp. V4]WIW89571.1 TonB-dependent receptor [Sphingobium sp. V4]
MRHYRSFILCGAAALALAISNASCAQEPGERDYNVAAQDLKYALRDLARQSGLELVAQSDALVGRKAPALRGHYSTIQALNLLLEGTGLTAEISDGTIFIRGRSEPPRAADAASDSSTDIIVTGSQIRGLEPGSPVRRDSREAIERAGYTDLGSYARSVAQNYAGGQNPGVISSVQAGSENVNASSTLNLRGLGADATLTLLNGHRLAYDAAHQGIDISAIPLIAVDRIEIVTDGASALYGSDAVGGVANIILRKDYQGILASARVGGATEGGNMQQQYSAIAGRRWDSGGFALSAEYSKSSDITAGQRSYTKNLQPNMTIFPWQRSFSGVLSAHQTIKDGVELSLDAHLNDHRSRAALPFTTTLDADQSGVITTPKVFSYSVSPTIKINLPSDWQLTVRGTRASSDSKVQAAIYFGGALFARNKVRYDNGFWSGEGNVEGPLISLPGGVARLALGVGVRVIQLDASIQQVTSAATTALVDYHDRRTVSFGYGELSVPVVGSANAMSLVRRLILSAAVRYEHYSQIGGLATPKMGIIYAPVEDLTLKASWGRSFKAPTLAQINQAQSGTLVPSTDFFPLPPDSRNILLLTGGGGRLKPEKASAWTISAEFKPKAVPGLSLGISRFDVHYRDRVVVPILNYTQAFSGSIYRNLIAINPTVSQVLQATSNLPLGVDNQTSDPYDPALVGAIIGNQYQNAAQQHIKGFDVVAAYDFTIGRDQFNLNANASYLQSNQKLSADQPIQQSAGLIFNPPHWRARASAGWTRDIIELTAGANYIGGTQDSRTTPTVKVGDFVSFDATIRIRPKASGALNGFELLASASNIFDEKPSLIRTSGGNSPPYDATNYSSVGRVLSLTLIKRF